MFVTFIAVDSIFRCKN